MWLPVETGKVVQVPLGVASYLVRLSLLAPFVIKPLFEVVEGIEVASVQLVLDQGHERGSHVLDAGPAEACEEGVALDLGDGEPVLG